MARLLYQGHGSYRLESSEGFMIYVDPYAGKGYDIPADLILVTHQHGDHNQISIVAKKPDCRIITENEALEGGKYNSFDVNGISIQAVEANNKNHSPDKCVGYIISLDGITLYASGDTSATKQMETFASKKLDYALFPCDGIYNMDVEEASRCAETVKARHSIPVHIKPGALFDRKTAEKFNAPGRIIVEPGEEINL